MTSIELLMRRAHELARNGLGTVSPNPLVGCVLVDNNEIIGEGWHRAYGGPHAEVNAIESVKDKHRIPGCSVFVNLEPCTHHGKTPPCADFLIRHEVGKVIISNVDTNPVVSGQGVARLRAAGVEVETGVLEQKGRQLNRRFFTFVEQRRPYVILKWAQTNEDLMAGETGDPRWISNSISRQLVHRWRAEEDAVLVGYKTALHDNPRLNVRDWTGRNPLRIVIDRELALPHTLHVFDKSQRTMIVNTKRNEEAEGVRFVKLDDRDFTRSLLSFLHAQGIQSVLVEGGASTLDLFINSGLWDEARVFKAPLSFKKGLQAPSINGTVCSTSDIAGDILTIYQNAIPTAFPLK